MSQRRYRDFVSRINIDAFENAIGFSPDRTDGNNNDIGQCPDIWNLHKNGDTTGKFAIHRDKKVYHCVTGDTEVMTALGVVTAKELEGETADVLTEDGSYRPAAWRSFGTDRIYEVTFENGDVIQTTKDHRWKVTREKGEPWSSDRRTWVTTSELEGRRVPLQTPYLFEYDEEEYRFGVLHGMVYGDGTLYMGGKYTKLPGYGDEDRCLIREYCDEYSEYIYKGVEQTCGRKLPSHFKILPESESDSYIRGFIAGLIAADGHVSSKASPVIHQADNEALEAIRRLAAGVGIPSSSIRMERKTNPWTGEFCPLFCLTLVRSGFKNGGKVDEKLLLKPSHFDNALSWPSRTNTHTVKVVSVQDTGKTEEVYCCTEPVTTTWVTGLGYLTGNCWVCGGGSLLSFVMEWKSFDEEAAAKWLYQFASEDAISTEQFADEVDKMLGDSISTELALPYFNSKVLDQFSAAPSEWLESRNISFQVAQDFGVKYNAESERHSSSADYVGPSIIFPHFWDGKVVGWQSRWLDETRPNWIPKYTNTSDFPKETTIYNFGPYRDEVLVVCESVPTVLVLASMGIPAMATFGSSVSERQITLLKRFQQGLYVSPDNDGAGVKYLDTLYEGLERFIPLKLIEPVGSPDSGSDLADLEAQEIKDRIHSAEYL